MSWYIHGWSNYLCNSKNAMDLYIVLQKEYPCHCNNNAHVCYLWITFGSIAFTRLSSLLINAQHIQHNYNQLTYPCMVRYKCLIFSIFMVVFSQISCVDSVIVLVVLYIYCYY